MIGIDPIDFVTCAICGHQAKKLGSHLKRIHTLTAKEYMVQHPNSLMLCLNTQTALTQAHKGRINWVEQMKQDGKLVELQQKIDLMSQAVSSAVLSDAQERNRRSKLLGNLNRTDDFRNRASVTAIKTSARVDVQQARAANLKKWREEYPQEFYDKCTSQMVKMQSSRPEKTLALWVQTTFPNVGFKPSQKLYNVNFSTVSKQRQLDISTKIKGIVIEFDGPVHFKNIPGWDQLENVQKRDHEVNELLSKEFLFIRVSHDQWHSKKGFVETCLNQIRTLIEEHLLSPSPKLVCIGWAYAQDIDHSVASRITKEFLDHNG